MLPRQPVIMSSSTETDLDFYRKSHNSLPEHVRSSNLEDNCQDPAFFRITFKGPTER